MKKLLVFLLAAVLLLCAAGCGAKTKTVNCDGCGAEVEVDEKSAMNDEEWIIYCEDCEKANGLDNFFEE